MPQENRQTGWRHRAFHRAMIKIFFCLGFLGWVVALGLAMAPDSRKAARAYLQQAQLYQSRAADPAQTTHGRLYYLALARDMLRRASMYDPVNPELLAALPKIRAALGHRRERHILTESQTAQGPAAVARRVWGAGVFAAGQQAEESKRQARKRMQQHKGRGKWL